jgi:hypothetical protein
MPPLARPWTVPALVAALALAACGAPNAAPVATPPAPSASAPLASSSSSAATTEPSMRKSTPDAEPAAEPVEGEAFLAAHETDEAFEIRFASPKLDGYLSKKRCAYFEWAHGEGRDLSTYDRGFHSEGDVEVLATAGARTFRFALSTRKLRPYLTPSFDRQAHAGEAWVPVVVAEELAKAKAPVWVVEHCLALDARYQARVYVETYSLPPRGPGQPPGRGRNRVLQVSDRPFVDGRPQGEVTPAFRRWSY